MPALLTDAPSPVRLTDLAAPQPGAVVSRLLLKRPSGSTTLFAFGAGEGLSPHACPYDALAVALTGALDVDLEGDTHRLAPGEALALPAGRPHAVHAPEAAQMLLVMLRA